MELYKPPGVADTIDWASALAALGRTQLDEHTVDVTLGTVLKYREDQERVRANGLGERVGQAVSRGWAWARAGRRCRSHGGGLHPSAAQGRRRRAHGQRRDLHRGPG